MVQARQTNIKQFLESKGVHLKRVGRGEYRHPDHDSLQIKDGNCFNWFSRNIKDGKNAITLVMELYGWDFQTAVKELTGFTPCVRSSDELTDDYQPYRSEVNTDCKRVIAYLSKTRGLDYKTVVSLIKDGKLRQDQRGNACFIRANGSAELHGTGGHWKGQNGSQDGYGFEYAVRSSVKWVSYCESAIDLLSLYQLNKGKLNDMLLVSMSGLKPEVIRHYLEIYPKAVHIVAVDNDEKGREFWERVSAEFPKLKARLPKNVKDWNDLLRLSLSK